MAQGRLGLHLLQVHLTCVTFHLKIFQKVCASLILDNFMCTYLNWFLRGSCTAGFWTASVQVVTTCNKNSFYQVYVHQDQHVPATCWSSTSWDTYVLLYIVPLHCSIFRRLKYMCCSASLSAILQIFKFLLFHAHSIWVTFCLCFAKAAAMYKCYLCACDYQE